MCGMDIAERRAPQDGRVSIRRGEDTIDVRVAVLPTAHGEKVTMRILNQGEAPASLAALGMWSRSRALVEHAISPAVRGGRRLRPDRCRQDDDALRLSCRS